MIEELKKISKHTLIYAFGVILGKAIGFFLIPLYTHYLTPEDYGILELLELTSWFIGCFIAMGVQNAILRYFAHYESHREKYEVISTATLFVMLSGGILTSLLVTLSAFFSNAIFNTTKYAFLFGIVFVNLFIGILLELGKSSLRAEGKSISFTVISIIYTFIAVSLNIFFIVVLKLGIKGILFSTFIVQFIIVGYLFIYFYPKTRFRFSLMKLKLILKYGIPFIPTGIFMFILNWADRYFLKVYANLEIIGLYSLGYKLSMIVALLGGFPFALFWNAYMFEVYKKSNAKDIYAKVLTYYTLILVSIALVLSCLSKELVTIIADPAFLNAYLVIPLISFSMALMPLDNVLRVGMLTSNKTFYLPYIEGVTAAIHIGFNFWLIRQLGMIGAGVSTLFAYIFRAVATWYISHRIYPIKFEYKRILIIFGNAIILIAISKLLNLENLIISILFKGSLILVFPILLYLTNFFNEKEKALIKEKFSMLPKVMLRFLH